MEDLMVHLVQQDEELLHQDLEAHLKASLKVGVHLHCTRAQEMEDSTIIRTRSGCIIS